MVPRWCFDVHVITFLLLFATTSFAFRTLPFSEENATGRIEVQTVLTDSNGNVIIGGLYNTSTPITFTLSNTPLSFPSSSSFTQVFLTKLSPNHTVLSFLQFRGSGNSRVHNVTMDNGDNITLWGQFPTDTQMYLNDKLQRNNDGMQVVGKSVAKLDKQFGLIWAVGIGVTTTANNDANFSFSAVPNKIGDVIGFINFKEPIITFSDKMKQIDQHWNPNHVTTAFFHITEEGSVRWTKSIPSNLSLTCSDVRFDHNGHFFYAIISVSPFQYGSGFVDFHKVQMPVTRLDGLRNGSTVVVKYGVDSFMPYEWFLVLSGALFAVPPKLDTDDEKLYVVSYFMNNSNVTIVKSGSNERIEINQTNASRLYLIQIDLDSGNVSLFNKSDNMSATSINHQTYQLSSSTESTSTLVEIHETSTTWNDGWSSVPSSTISLHTTNDELNNKPTRNLIIILAAPILGSLFAIAAIATFFVIRRRKRDKAAKEFLRQTPHANVMAASSFPFTTDSVFVPVIPGTTGTEGSIPTDLTFEYTNTVQVQKGNKESF